jgi:hypothetical protein
MGEYVPGAPVSDEARERNKNLPGMGGVFNLVNLHTYHYAGNNPVVLVDPTGLFLDIVGDTIYCDLNQDDIETAKNYMENNKNNLTISGETRITKIIARNRENGNSINIDRSAINFLAEAMKTGLEIYGLFSDTNAIIKQGIPITGKELLGQIKNVNPVAVAGTLIDFINFLNDSNWDTGTDLAFSVVGFAGTGGAIASLGLKSGKLFVVNGVKLLTETYWQTMSRFFYDFLTLTPSLQMSDSDAKNFIRRSGF